VLYELSTGRRPFASREPAALVAEITGQRPMPPRHLNPSVPPPLEAIILRCLEKSPAHRYQTAQDLASDLRRLAAGHTPESASHPSLSISRASRWPWATAVVLAAAASVALWSWISSRPGTAGIAPSPLATRSTSDSVAVLPFVNMSGNPDNEYLGDGISEEVINAVARTGQVDVVARTSAFSFKGKNIDVREIARQLGVEMVLEGSVRQAGGRLRVTAQLVKAADGYHIWSETFDRAAGDIFAIQDDIARAVVLQVAPAAGAATPIPDVPPTSDVRAYDHFLRGRHAYGT
jgi:TolB-like protein